MSRRKQTKPLRLNEDEELQPGRRLIIQLLILMPDAGLIFSLILMLDAYR